MCKLLVLVVMGVLVAASRARSLQEPAATLGGDYKFIYSWPKLAQDVPNCSPVLITAADSSSSNCGCGRQSANIGLITLQSRSRSFTVLADVVSNNEELQQALSDKCSCVGFDHTVVMKLAGGYMVHYDTKLSKGFLIGTTVPSADQLQHLVSSLPFDAKDGTVVCQ